MGYEVLENQMQSVISNLEKGKEFMLKDIISNPPAGLGRILYQKVKSKDIPNVKYMGKKNDVDVYVKL